MAKRKTLTITKEDLQKSQLKISEIVNKHEEYKSERIKKLKEDLKSGGTFQRRFNNVFAFYYSSLEDEEVKTALNTLRLYIAFRVYKAAEDYRSHNEKIEDINKNETVLLLPAGNEFKTVSKDRIIIVSMSKNKDGETKYKTKVMKLDAFEKNYVEPNKDEPPLFGDEDFN